MMAATEAGVKLPECFVLRNGRGKQRRGKQRGRESISSSDLIPALFNSSRGRCPPRVPPETNDLRLADCRILCRPCQGLGIEMGAAPHDESWGYCLSPRGLTSQPFLGLPANLGSQAECGAVLLDADEAAQELHREGEIVISPQERRPRRIRGSTNFRRCGGSGI
jgi:hypothetical protein